MATRGHRQHEWPLTRQWLVVASPCPSTSRVAMVGRGGHDRPSSLALRSSDFSPSFFTPFYGSCLIEIIANKSKQTK